MITWNIEVIVFLILLLDAIGANLFVWLGGENWLKKNLRFFNRFSASKFLAFFYLMLILWMGYLLYSFGYIQF